MKPRKKPTQSDRQRKLELRKERVRVLDREQLDQVNGGCLMPTYMCTTTDRS